MKGYARVTFPTTRPGTPVSRKTSGMPKGEFFPVGLDQSPLHEAVQNAKHAYPAHQIARIGIQEGETEAPIGKISKELLGLPDPDGNWVCAGVYALHGKISYEVLYYIVERQP